MLVALLEDDPSQSAFVHQIVESMGHQCSCYAEGRLLLQALRRNRFDLLLVDWHVPDISGYEVVRWARAELDTRVPIVFVSGRSDEKDVVAGLDAGADDYIVKPVREYELRARLSALLRRVYPTTTAAIPYDVGPYRIDMSRRRIFLRGEAIELTPKEYELALLLFSNLGRILSREYVVSTVWGREVAAMSRTLDTHFSRVRTKLQLRAENGVRLLPVYSHGYRFEKIDESPLAAI